MTRNHALNEAGMNIGGADISCLIGAQRGVEPPILKELGGHFVVAAPMRREPAALIEIERRNREAGAHAGQQPSLAHRTSRGGSLLISCDNGDMAARQAAADFDMAARADYARGYSGRQLIELATTSHRENQPEPIFHTNDTQLVDAMNMAIYNRRVDR